MGKHVQESYIGQLSNLQTTDKSNIVAAINEMKASSGKTKVNSYVWSAVANQTVFTIGTGSYIPNSGNMEVHVGGKVLISGTDYTETSPTTFTLLTITDLEAGDTVYAKWFENVNLAASSTVVEDNLTSSSNANALSANQGKQLNNKIGNLSNLNTTTKTDVVSAINEVNNKNQTKVNQQYWTASVGQKVFNITSPGNYIINKGNIQVFVGGIALVSGQDFTETSSTSFTLTNSDLDGEVVFAKWFEQVSVVASSTVVEDSLTSTNNTNALSANQGRVLSNQLASISVLAPMPNGTDDTTNLKNLFAGGNKKILFPYDGQYIVSSPINLFSNTQVEVKGNVEFFLKANSPCYMFIADGASFQNITWKGGIINGNDANQGAETGSNYDTCKGMVFKNVTNLCVEKVTLKNIRGHGINHWNCNYATFRDIQVSQGLSTLNTTGGSRRDGVTGMSSNLLIENISGFSDDDLVAVLSGVDWAGTNTVAADIQNVVVRNIRPQKHSSGRNPWRAVAIYTSGGFTSTNVTVDGLYGDCNDSIILIGNYGKPTRGNVKNLTVTNVYGEANYVYTYDYGQIRIEDVYINNVTFKNIVSNQTTPTTAKRMLITKNKGDIDRVVLDNIVYNVYIDTTDYNAIFREYDTGNVSSFYASQVSLNFLGTNYTNGFLYFKNNTVAVTTKLYLGSGIYISPPKHTNNGTNTNDTKAQVYATGSNKFSLTDSKVLALKTHLSGTVGDVVRSPIDGDLKFFNNQFLTITNPTSGKKTATGFTTWDSSLKILVFDGTGQSGFPRLQDLQDGTALSSYPDGYRIIIKRIDNNSGCSPYIRLTNDQLIDGVLQTNLNTYATIVLEYYGGTWYKVN